MKCHDAKRRTEILEACYDCFCRYGLEKTNIKQLAEACNMSTANLFNYFKGKDEIIVDATAHCMAKVEEDFMSRAPSTADEVKAFVTEMPYVTAKLHGAKYRFMYQVYSSPQYREHGIAFFKGVTERYTEYAKLLGAKIGVSWKLLQPMIFTFVRACVHYALFENEDYLLPQTEFLLRAFQVMCDLGSSRVKAENIPTGAC